ncbi:MAG: MTH1187 family thiamine-binding protein [Candidatus Micrarchaeaceae archaeon]
MAILVDISIIPIPSKGTSISKYVKKALEIMKKNRMKFYPAPAMTTVEISDFAELADLLRQLYAEILGNDVKRMETILKIDVRTDKKNTLESRLNAIK